MAVLVNPISKQNIDLFFRRPSFSFNLIVKLLKNLRELKIEVNLFLFRKINPFKVNIIFILIQAK